MQVSYLNFRLILAVLEQRTVSEVLIIIKKQYGPNYLNVFFYSVYLYSPFLIFCLAGSESDESLVVLSILFLFFNVCFLQKTYM